MEKILSGTVVAKQIKTSLSGFIQAHDLAPRMALVQVGRDPASGFYVQNIIKQAAKLGCIVELTELPESSSENELLELIHQLNSDASIDGIMIQKPLPRHISDRIVNNSVNPEKDIDAVNPINLGLLMMESPGFIPCTPYAVYLIMRFYGIDASGRKLCIIGRSNVVGKPLAAIMLSKKPLCNATVTVCHSKTRNLPQIVADSEIVVAAIGVPAFVKEEWISPGCILIDVGINEVPSSDGKATFVGDIDYNGCLNKAMAITPVPGGVGSVTTAVLLMNLVKATLLNKKLNKLVDGFDDLIFNAK